MTFYVDSSALLRVVAGQAGPLKELQEAVAPVSSVIIEIEAARAIDRLRRAGEIEEADAVDAAVRGRRALRRFRLVELVPAVRLRAAGPFALPVRSLDAIHLASALLWHEANPDEELVMATHDERLAVVARAHGLPVIGVSDAR